MKRVAIQGFEGSYHDIATRLFFKEEETELICCETFDEVFSTLASDNDAVALVAIENTIAGSLLHNYELLRGSGMVIVGEQKLRIAHCICCLPDEDWADLHEVHSHPVALAQCEAFLQSHPQLKAVQAEDTALSAKEIKEKQLPELDDEFASEVSEFDTLAEYKEDVKKKLTEKKEAEAKNAKEDAVIAAIIEDATMDIPDAMVETQQRQMIEEFAQRIQSQGLSMEQ